MSSTVVIQGVVKPDGTLELPEKITLPAGPVQVTVTPLPELPKDDPFWQLMQGIWAGQKARGHVPRSAEAVESERRALREEWDERMRTIELIQQEARKLRERSTWAAVCERAARIRAASRFCLKAPDCLHLAAAIEHGCGSFLTNDRQLTLCTDIVVEILS